MNRSDSWAERYRPRTLDELIGQQKAVTRVKALLKAPRHLILSGPTGVGKTSITQPFAQSLMCTRNLAGEPACGQCDSCVNFAGGHNPSYHQRNGSDVTPEWLRAVVDVTSGTSFVGQCHIIHIEEAKPLSDHAKEALLQPLDGKAQRIFIFTLIDVGALPDQLRARCQEIELAPASVDTKIEYVERIARGEQLTITTEAAELLAHFSAGYRGVATNLQSVHDSSPGQELTLDDVRSTVLQDLSHGMLIILSALATGDWPSADQRMRNMRMGANAKHRALIDVLMYLKLKYVGPARSDERRFDLLFSRADCIQVLDQWDERAGSYGISLVALFDEVLEFCAFMPLHLDEEILRLQFIRLFDLVNIDRANRIGDEPTDWALRREQSFRSTSAARPRPRFRSLARRDQERDDHVSGGILRQLYEPATFLPQVSGDWLNSFAEMHFRWTGGPPDYSAISKFGKDLAARLATWGGELSPGVPRMPLHRISLLESDGQGDLIARVVFHLPDEVLDKAHEWITDYRSKLLGKGSVTAFYQDLPSAGRSHARQWTLMRRLWRGVDPALVLDDVPAFERLRIPKSQLRPAGAVPKGRRFNLSQSLSPQARKREADKGMPHLSPWADGAWDWLFSGWEAAEHAAREIEIQRRKRTMAQLEMERDAAGDAIHRRAMERIILDERASWPLDPHERHRLRTLWW